MNNFKLLLTLLVFIGLQSCNDDNEVAICNISNLTIDLGQCNNDNSYSLTLEFEYVNPNSDFFDLYLRNDFLLGNFSLSNIPLTIDSFPLSGLSNDYIKVCINDVPDCCEVIEFAPPNCETTITPCDVRDVTVDVGECNDDGTYNFTLDFIYDNPGNQFFDLYIGNNVLFGYYSLNDLPIVIENFSPRPNNDYDFIKVCINDMPDCCMPLEFMQPDCESNSPCDVRDVTVDVGECNDDGTYNFTLDFIYDNPGNQFFDLYIGNNVLFGYYSLNDLPIVIENFSPRPNNDYDFIKVCINDMPDCCMPLEFMQPDC